MERDYIFISYRRLGAQDVSKKIFDVLADHFAGFVFRDLDDLSRELGTDFRIVIERALNRSKVELVIIDPLWIHDKRLWDSDDYVRIEIVSALALSADIHIIPVLVPGAEMPKASELPEALQELAYKQAFKLPRSDIQPADLQLLIDRLENTYKIPSKEQRLRGLRAGLPPQAPDPRLEFYFRNGMDKIASKKVEDIAQAIKSFGAVIAIDPNYLEGLARQQLSTAKQHLALLQAQQLDAEAKLAYERDRGETEQWLKYMEQLADFDQSSDGVKKLVTQARSKLIAHFRKQAIDATQRRDWTQVIVAWNKVLAYDSGNVEAQRQLSVARNLQKADGIYEELRHLADHRFPSEQSRQTAQELFSRIWQLVPEYGDPDNLASQFGIETPATIQQRAAYRQQKQDEEQLALRQKQQRQQEITSGYGKKVHKRLLQKHGSITNKAWLFLGADVVLSILLLALIAQSQPLDFFHPSYLTALLILDTNIYYSITQEIESSLCKPPNT